MNANSVDEDYGIFYPDRDSLNTNYTDVTPTRSLKKINSNGTDILAESLIWPMFSILSFTSILNTLVRKKTRFAYEKIFYFQKKKSLSLTQKKIAMMKCVENMIEKGRINLTQRSIWRWRLFCKKKTTPVQSMKINRKYVLSSLYNRYRCRLARNIDLMFSRWKLDSLETPKGKLSLYRKNRYFALKSIIKAFNKKCWFHRYQSKVLINYKLNLKFILNLLNMRFKTHLSQYFQKLKNNFEWEYTEEIGEIKKMESKKFYMMKKPSVPLYYYDNNTSDPTFRAVFRCLGHFIKRNLKDHLEAWKNFSFKKYSINSMNTESSIEISNYKLDSNTKNKLKDIVIHFYLISQQILEMPANYVSKWAERTHIKNMKLKKTAVIVYQNQINSMNKKFFFKATQIPSRVPGN
jgi:hypothetical protein